MGFVLDFVSYPVMSAYVTSSAIIILTSQIKDFLGLTLPRSTFWWESVRDILSALQHTHGPTVALSLTLLLILVFLKSWKTAGNAETRATHRLWRWFPKDKDSRAFAVFKSVVDLSALICVILGWVWGYIYQQAGVKGLKRVGSAQMTGLVVTSPVQNLQSLPVDLIPSAFVLAFMGYMETMGIGTKLASQWRYQVNPSQELLGLGAANIVSSMMSGLVVCSGFSRSAAAASFGATSPFSAWFAALVVLLTIYLIMPVIEQLPTACLAPLIMQAATGLLALGDFVKVFRSSKLEFLCMVVTLVFSLGFTVKEGLISGLVCSILKLLYDISRPNMAVCGRAVDGNFRDVRYFPEAEMPINSVVVRIDARLSFVNSRRFKEFCLRASTAGDVQAIKYLIMDFKSVNGVDPSGHVMLEELAEVLHKRGQGILIANLKGPVAASLRAAQLDARLKKYNVHFFLSVDDALSFTDDSSTVEAALSKFIDLDQRVKSASPQSKWSRSMHVRNVRASA